MNKIFRYVFGCTVALTLAACGGDEPDDGGGTVDFFSAFVTISEITDDGASFTTREKGDSPLITYTTKQSFDKTAFPLGERMVMYYQTNSGVQWVSGEINIISALIPEGKGAPVPQNTAAATLNWQSHAISLYYAQRSGEYIDVICQIISSPQAEQIAMYVDEATLDDEYPELHIIFKARNAMAGEMSTYALYMSYSIADILARPTCKGVRLYCADPTLKEPVQFDKTTSNLTPIN